MSDVWKERAVQPTSWGAVLLLLVPGVLLASPLSTFVVQAAGAEAYECDGPSMEPTLLHGDRFMVDRGAYGLAPPHMERAWFTWAEPTAGDVLVIHSPYDGIDIVKRVVGVGGDEVEIRDDVVLVNGEPLTRQPWATRGARWTSVEGVGSRQWTVTVDPLSPPANSGPVTVAEGELFVLGDHRDRSNDSRNIGGVPLANVVGRVVGLYWSSDDGVRFERIGMVLP